MHADQALMDEIYRDRVIRARKVSIEKKVFAGLELFDDVCDRMRAGIRHQFPEFGPEEVQKELRRRLHISRVLENRR